MAIEAFRSAFPDPAVEVSHQVEEADTVVSRWTVRASQAAVPSRPAQRVRAAGNIASVEAELVALNVLHHEARLVVVIGGQQPDAYRAQRDQPCTLGFQGR